MLGPESRWSSRLCRSSSLELGNYLKKWTVGGHFGLEELEKGCR